MDACCHDHDEKAAKKAEKGCCEACPTAKCEGCDCSKPEKNPTGCCMGGGCACGNGR